MTATSPPTQGRVRQLAALPRAVRAWIGTDPIRLAATTGPLIAAAYLLIALFPDQVARVSLACAAACAVATFVAWSVLAARLWRGRSDSGGGA